MDNYFELTPAAALELARALKDIDVHDDLVNAAKAVGGQNMPDYLYTYVSITPNLRCRVSKS
jgi:hypothetical protein